MSDISSSRSVRRSASSHSGASSSGRHSTMPTYTHQYPKVVVPVKHSSSLEYHQKRDGGARRASTPYLEKLTPRQFLEKYSLPRVVRVVTEEGRGDLGPLSQPLLLYRQYKSTKVLARSVSNPKQAREVGPSLVIPGSYQGWFSQVATKGQLTAVCYTSIQQLVSARVTAFLPRQELVAYKLNDSKGGSNRESIHKSLQYLKTTMKAGHVIKLLAVFEDINHVEVQNNRRLSFPLFGRLTSKANKYAQCLTGKNQTVFIPLTTTGQFYAAAGVKGLSESQCVSQMALLLRDMKDPLQVHLVMGPLPTPLPAGFTGNLLLEGYEEEDVILACTLSNDIEILYNQIGSSGNTFNPGTVASPSVQTQPKFLEIDADSQFLLSRPLLHHESETRLFKTPLLQSTLAYCRDNGDSWRRQIKVTHHICPAAGPGLTPTPEAPKEKLNKSHSKIRRATKKSASFTYTSSSAMKQEPSTVNSQDQGTCDIQNLILSPRNRAETCVISNRNSEKPPSNFTHPVHCQYTNRSTVVPTQDIIQPSIMTPQPSGFHKRSIPTNIQNRELPSIIMAGTDDLPYSRVADAIVGAMPKTEFDGEENVYAEICEYEPNHAKGKARNKLDYFFMRAKSVDRTKDDYYYVQLEGGNDGRCSGSVTSRPESESNYDTVC